MKRKIIRKLSNFLPFAGIWFVVIAVILLTVILTSFSGKEIYHKRFFEDFKKRSSKYFDHNFKGNEAHLRYEFGKESPTETGTNIVSFKINPDDPAGAGKGPEIISKHFTHFGTYAARLKVPDVSNIQPNVGAVVGYFTYHMDKQAGLSEIDFEWLIADPEIIYVGTWTGPRGDLRRVGRAVNLAKGIIYNTEYRESKSGIRNALTGMQNQPETIPTIKGYNASTQFYTYGFDWFPERIRWWMIHPATADTIVLWDYKGSKIGIPTNPTHYRLNFWHTNNWPVETNPKSVEKPVKNYELEIDWMVYEPLYR